MINNIDKIGYFKGKAISSMTRDELLEFARYAGKELSDFIEYKAEHHDLDLQKEIFSKRSTQSVKIQCMCGHEHITAIRTGYVGRFLGYVRAKGWSLKKRVK